MKREPSIVSTITRRWRWTLSETFSRIVSISSSLFDRLHNQETSMKTTILKGLKVVAAAIGIAGFSVASAAGFTMKIAHSANPGESRDLGAHRMADMLNSKNSCDLKVQVYPSSQLGGSNDMIQLLQLGSVEATLLPASFLVGFQPLLGIMDLPYYLPDDPQKLLQIHKSQAMKDL